MPILSKTAAALFISATLLSPLAFASAWQITDNQTAEAPTYVFAETDTGAVLLACAEGKLKSQISNDGSDFAARLRMTAKYSRGVDVGINFGDADETSSRWKLYPAVDTIYSNSHSQSAKLFNSVVRGEKVSVTVDGEAYTEFTPPAVDETFAAFAKTCRGS